MTLKIKKIQTHKSFICVVKYFPLKFTFIIKRAWQLQPKNLKIIKIILKIIKKVSKRKKKQLNEKGQTWLKLSLKNYNS